MRKSIAICLAAIVALLAAGALPAHHSGSMYDPTPVWIQGNVVSFEDINPHSLTTLEQRRPDGQIRRWIVEGPGQAQIDRRRDGLYLPQVGDSVTFCAFPYKSVEELARMFPEADFSNRRFAEEGDDSSPRFVWGHVMVRPDGQIRIWNPHGVFAECIRSADGERGPWLDLLNGDSRTWQLWCQQTDYTSVESNASLSEFVREINDSLDNPCR